MPKSSTNVEPKDKKDNLKQRTAASTAEHIEANVEVVDGAVGAKSDLQELTASLKQGFAQISQDLSKTIAESFKLFQSELEIQYEDIAGVEQEETPQTANDHEVNGEPPAKKKKYTKMTDSAGAQETPSNEGNFEVLNSLKQELKKEETGPRVNAELANVVNAMVTEGLPEEKLQEKLNKYHRPENCESLTKVRANQSIWDHLTPAVRSKDVKTAKGADNHLQGNMCIDYYDRQMPRSYPVASKWKRPVAIGNRCASFVC